MRKLLLLATSIFLFLCYGTELRAQNLSTQLYVGPSGWATLMLAFSTTIPEGVEVYAVSEVTDTRAILSPVKDILPANTAVLIKAEEGDYTFIYTTSEKGYVEKNLLNGSLYDKNIDGPAYVLSVVDEIVGFYPAKLTNGKFLNNANKAYLPASEVTAGARYLRFSTDTETGIIETGNVKRNNMIYDLSGRCVQKVQRGLFIVNGKKMVY